MPCVKSYLGIEILVSQIPCNAKTAGVGLGQSGRTGDFEEKNAQVVKDAYHIKSVQWLQNVGCLKNLAINLWFFTSCTFFCRKAPFRANRFPTPAESL